MAGLLGAAAIAIYVWAAFNAPVVLWSDSEVDLSWARQGFGIFRPIPPPVPGEPIGHLPKPGYLLFLRLAMRAFPYLKEARSVVVVQSLLLALAILGTALWIARRRGTATGLSLGVACLIFLRLRDASSAVMTEALAAALLLPIGAAMIEPSRWKGAGAVLGVACGALFLVRPNCAGAVVAIGVFVFAAARETRRLLFFLAGFAVIGLPSWYLGRSNLPGDPLHGLGYQIVESSAEYYWTPSIVPWPVGETPGQAAAEELRVARENWKRTLSEGGPDRRRELVWRAFHGLLGIEFYDSRWSVPYASATTASRILSPFLILGAVTILLASPWRPAGRAKLAGITLLLLLVAQNLLLGSNPRYALPLIPLLFLFATVGSQTLRGSGGLRALALGVCLAGLLLAARWQRQILDWQWGKIEATGVTIIQPIPKGALPASGPATLHLRVAPALAAAPAGLDVFGPGGRLLYSSGNDAARQRPLITIPLPAWILSENRDAPVELRLVSHGGYGATSFLLFPVIPRMWSAPAERRGSGDLSPTTGIHSGSIDWWSHPGSP